MSTVRIEALHRGAAEIPMQPASYDIWDKKYRLKTKQGEPVDASIDHTYQRVAKALSEVEDTPEKQKYWYERFVWAPVDVGIYCYGPDGLLTAHWRMGDGATLRLTANLSANEIADAPAQAGTTIWGGDSGKRLPPWAVLWRIGA